MGIKVKFLDKKNDKLNENEVEIKIFPFKYKRLVQVDTDSRIKLLSAFFVIGIVVFCVGILFEDTFAFILGLCATILTILCLKIEHYKSETPIAKKRTALAVVLLIFGIIVVGMAIVWSNVVMLISGIIIGVYDAIYLLGGKTKDVKKRIQKTKQKIVPIKIIESKEVAAKKINKDPVKRKSVKTAKESKFNKNNFLYIGVLIIIVGLVVTGILDGNNVIMSIGIGVFGGLMYLEIQNLRKIKSKDSKKATKFLKDIRKEKFNKVMVAVGFLILLILLGYSLIRFKSLLALIALIVVIVTYSGVKRARINYMERLEDKIKIESKPKVLDSFQTDLDRLYNLVIKNKSVNIKMISEKFKVSRDVAEKWGVILEQKGLLVVKYPPVGLPIIELPKPKIEGVNEEAN